MRSTGYNRMLNVPQICLVVFNVDEFHRIAHKILLLKALFNGRFAK